MPNNTHWRALPPSCARWDGEQLLLLYKCRYSAALAKSAQTLPRIALRILLLYMLVQEKLQSDRGSDGTRILLSVLLGNGTTASCNGEMKGVIEIFNLVVSFNYPEAALCGSAAGSQVAISRIRLFQINPSSPLVPAPGRWYCIRR